MSVCVSKGTSRFKESALQLKYDSDDTGNHSLRRGKCRAASLSLLWCILAHSGASSYSGHVTITWLLTIRTQGLHVIFRILAHAYLQMKLVTVIADGRQANIKYQQNETGSCRVSLWEHAFIRKREDKFLITIVLALHWRDICFPS